MLILVNAQIHTLDSKTPTAKAVAIDYGRILYLGEEGDTLAKIKNWSKTSPSNNVIIQDLHGRTVIPGLTDAHIHLEQFALGMQKIDCETATQEECIKRVKEQVTRTPVGVWILGHGWNQNNWAQGFGSAEALDAVAPNHPVYLTAKSLHAGWANSAALRMANLSDGTPDPAGGRLGRNERGQLNGILFESAMTLLEACIPNPDEYAVSEAIDSVQPILWRMGITGVHDFDRRRCFKALQILHQKSQLKLRVIKSIPWNDLELAIGLGLRSGFGDDYLRIGSVKAFADGALGPQTAAMLQPYEQGADDNRGMLLLDAEEIYEHGRLAVANGLSLAVHAIGDRANHEVLKAYSQMREFEAETQFGGDQKAAIKTGLRHRIEHVQLLHSDDAGRLAELGVIASMQPIHATSDMLMADRYWGDRAALSYALKTQVSQGAVTAFGSDAPVESPNPFWGIHAAVTRQRLDGTPGLLGWYPDQRLTVDEAIHGYTTGAAFAGGMEDRIGKISPGYLADLAVLNENPFTCLPDQLHEIHALATMVGGEWVLNEL